MVIALEPIIAESPTAVFEDDDGWTIRTATVSRRALRAHDRDSRRPRGNPHRGLTTAPLTSARARAHYTADGIAPEI